MPESNFQVHSKKRAAGGSGGGKAGGETTKAASDNYLRLLDSIRARKMKRLEDTGRCLQPCFHSRCHTIFAGGLPQCPSSPLGITRRAGPPTQGDQSGQTGRGAQRGSAAFPSQEAPSRAGGRAPQAAGMQGEAADPVRRPATPSRPARGSVCAGRRQRGRGGLRRAAARRRGGPPASPPLPSRPPARPRRGPARPLRPLPRRHAQTQFLEKDGDSREAETRRAGEDRPLHPGGHAGGRHLRQSEG